MSVTIKHGRTGSLVTTGELVYEDDEAVTIRVRSNLERIERKAIWQITTSKEKLK